MGGLNKKILIAHLLGREGGDRLRHEEAAVGGEAREHDLLEGGAIDGSASRAVGGHDIRPLGVMTGGGGTGFVAYALTIVTS